MDAYERALTALADPTRRMVFERLRGGEKSVQELADGLHVSRPAVSQHLKVLKEAGLVRDRAEGTRRFYEASREGLDAIRSWIDGFWDHALEQFKQAAEREAKNPKPKKEHE